MAKLTQRTNIGPSARYIHEEDNVQIATETSFVEDEQGIRRLVAKGSRVPAHLRLDTKGEEVNTQESVAPAIDEEAAKPQHERQGYDGPEQTNTMEQVAGSAALGGRKRRAPKAAE